MARASIALSLVLGLTACGGAPPPAPVRAQTPPPAVVAPQPEGPRGVIQRAELDRVLEGGLGRFLQCVTTEADLRNGRFVGFRLTELRDEALFTGVDLQPGDTIVEVNGQGIERPEHAFSVWSSLRVASELMIVVLRGEERRELRFAILD